MNKPNVTKTLGAGVAGTIAMTLMAMAAPMMGMPEMNIPKMLAHFMSVPVAAGWMAHFAIGMVLAIGYANVFVAKLPGSPLLRGVLFALVPWFMAQIVVNPMMGAGVFALNTDAPLMMVVGSLVGHLVYGAVLGLVYGTAAQHKAAIA